MKEIKLTTPLTKEVVSTLRAGQTCLLSGTIYTARDAAHKLLVEAMEKGEQLPVELEGQLIFYVGPSPAPPGKVIGSAGPTTSTRMDVYTPAMLEAGVRGVIGKGNRSPQVVESLKEHQAVYFGAIGGAGALLARQIKEAQVVAYPELGPEAIHRLRVEDFPLVVVIDSLGQNYYTLGRSKYSNY